MLMHRPQTPQPGVDSITLLQKFTPHFKILDPRLKDIFRWLMQGEKVMTIFTDGTKMRHKTLPCYNNLVS